MNMIIMLNRMNAPSGISELKEKARKREMNRNKKKRKDKVREWLKSDALPEYEEEDRSIKANAKDV